VSALLDEIRTIRAELSAELERSRSEPHDAHLSGVDYMLKQDDRLLNLRCAIGVALVALEYAALRAEDRRRAGVAP
jgi:hypothetical protein